MKFELGLCEIVTIVLMILKLVGIIDWSWVLITAPVWLPISICLVVLVICFLIKKSKRNDD